MESSKRKAIFDNEMTCYVCQSDKKDPKTKWCRNIPVIPIDVDRNDIKEQCEKWRKKVNRPANITSAIDILDDLFSQCDKPKLVWHRQCRPAFMSSTKLDRHTDETIDESMNIAEGAESDTEDHSALNNSMHLRSQAVPYNKAIHCVVCCFSEQNGKLHQVLSWAVHDKLHNKALNDYELMIRLESSRDAIAGDMLYHSLCLLDDKPGVSGSSSSKSISHDNSLCQLIRELEYRICRGQAVLLSECWSRFKQLCEEKHVAIPSYYQKRRAFLKYKITQRLPNITIIPCQGTELEDDLIISSALSLIDVCNLLNDDSNIADELKLPVYNETEMGQMVHVALYLRSLILEHPFNKKTELTEETAYASIPEALYVFIAIMYGGSDILDVDAVEIETEEDDYEKNSRLRKIILDIAQDMTYAVTNGNNIPPKHYALGMALHQLSGRNKKIVNLMHNTTQIMRYKQCLQADTALSEKKH